MITLTLPWPPTVNTMFPTSRSGHRFLSKRGKEFAVAVMKAVMLDRRGCTTKPETGRLAYRLSAWPPDKRTRDLSNLLKSVEDSLTKAGVWLDDSQVDHIEVDRMPIAKGGRCTIEIWNLDCEARPT